MHHLTYLEPFITGTQTQVDLPFLRQVLEQRQQWWNRPSATPYRQLLAELPPTPPHDGATNCQWQQQIRQWAQALIPWRKGPFNLWGVEIDSEWQSQWKWQRVAPFCQDLQGARVLDIGCNNGHYLFQMAGQRPALLLGIDPIIHTQAQFKFLQHWMQIPNLYHELLGIEHLPAFRRFFDVIFSMGIIYHHRHPIAQLTEIHQALRPGGYLILESIGIPGEQSFALFPAGSYAKMKNVWFIPTLSCLVNWVRKARFGDIEIIADSLLTTEEQRITPWCPPPHQSLADFLDPATNNTKTVEGYPAPRRFALKARK